MIKLVPYWDYLDNNNPFLDGFWLTCELHGEIKYFELLDPVPYEDIEGEARGHLDALHFS